MTESTPPFAALDDLLRQARHLMIDFDGPICTLYPGASTLAADQLRTLLTAHGVQLPDAIAEATDAITILAHVVSISPELAAQAEAELTEVERRAVASAQPTGYAHDVITSARESGRTVTIISTCAASAVNAYLANTSLIDLVDLVVARTLEIPAPAFPGLIHRAISELDAQPGTCAIIAESEPALHGAKAVGVAAIARNWTASEPVAADTGAIEASLADLALRLRARPLPN